MSEDIFTIVYVVGMVVWVLSALTYAGAVDDWEYAQGAFVAPIWPLALGFALIAGFCAGWMYLSRRAFLAIRPPAPKPDAYQIAAEQEVERLT